MIQTPKVGNVGCRNWRGGEGGRWRSSDVRKLGHVYNEWVVKILFTSTELRKLHRDFHYPNTGKLFDIMHMADPESIFPDFLDYLEQTTSICEVFQRESDVSHRWGIPNSRRVHIQSYSLSRSYEPIN